MRPLVIAQQPVDANGNPKVVHNYQDWRQDLIDNYGPHCAYCNVKLPNSANVEHEVAQSLHVVNQLQWNNLLLACSPCNIAKSNTHFTQNTHYLPNLHNTHLAFSYEQRAHGKLPNQTACVPIPNPQLNQQQRNKAQQTLDDLKLQRVEQPLQRQRRATDTRWKNRYEVWLESVSARDLWDTLDTQLQKDAFLMNLRTSVFNTGFFSLWYNAFQNVPQALQVILTSFPQTHLNSFPVGNNYQPIPRINGDL